VAVGRANGRLRPACLLHLLLLLLLLLLVMMIVLLRHQRPASAGVDARRRGQAGRGCRRGCESGSRCSGSIGVGLRQTQMWWQQRPQTDARGAARPRH
jgi:hypothetical protein